MTKCHAIYMKNALLCNISSNVYCLILQMDIIFIYALCTVKIDYNDIRYNGEPVTTSKRKTYCMNSNMNVAIIATYRLERLAFNRIMSKYID